jgi:osmotically-inducible protein OsmY
MRKHCSSVVLSALTACLLLAGAGCQRQSTPATTTPKAQKKAPVKMNPDQRLGVDLVTAISKHPTLKGALISVGTSSTMITLDGTVLSPKQKDTAVALVKKTAPRHKIINRLKIKAARKH